MGRDDVLMHYRSPERPFVDRLMEVVRRVDERQAPFLTDFLDPRQAKIADSIARSAQDVTLHLDGGYDGAERRRALIVPSYWVPEADDFELAFLRVSIPGEYVTLAHGDYLGSLVGLGLKRSKLGDLHIHDDGCDLAVTRDIADFIRLNLVQVGRASVHLTEIEQDKMRATRSEYAEKEFTVMSLRIDAVAGESFGLSRSKVVDPIKSGKLQLNWQTIDNPATLVEEGDVISLRGQGRVKILEVGGQTKKGRTVLKVGKFI